jgi:hypothetical protein
MKSVYIVLNANRPVMAFTNEKPARTWIGKYGGELFSCGLMGSQQGWEFIEKTTGEMPLSKKKGILRTWYKRYKVGAVKWQDIPSNYQELLKKYYGIFGVD